MALVVEKIKTGTLEGMHDFVDTARDEYYGVAGTNEIVEANILQYWKDVGSLPNNDGKASERNYETEVVLIISPIEIMIGGK